MPEFVAVRKQIGMTGITNYDMFECDEVDKYISKTEVA